MSLRVLFASVHGYVDPSSGAALCTRDVLELLAGRGHDCRVVTAGVLDFERETTPESVLDRMGVPHRRGRVAAGAAGEAEVLELALGGVPVTILPTASSHLARSPDPAESLAFLGLADRALGEFRPGVLLTYGGHPANLELARRARARGIAVAFHLHNFAYEDRRAFVDASAVIFPSEYSRRYYGRRLGMDGPVLPGPLRPDRVVAPDPSPTYLVFVNPQPAKGVTVFARIAAELGRRRPDILLLVVEGRGASDWLGRVPLDLSGAGNLRRMANTPDPRDFYRVARAILLPSLWRESQGRVAVEALANGLPVLASDRGALPETLGDAGSLFRLPDRCTPDSAEVPTPHEVAPWVATVERLWDDPAYEAGHRARALAEATRWDAGRVIDAYEALFRSLARGA